MPAPVPRSGNLSEWMLCEILAALCQEGETGVLRLLDDGAEKAVYLQKGKVVFASSADPDDRLGELLMTRGVLTRAQYDEASHKVGPGKRLGTVLVELGFLPAADLPRWVLEQVKEILFSLFSWTTGTYRFEAGPLPSKEMITLRISAAEIFLTGLRRVQKWSVLRKGAGDIRTLYRLTPNWREILKEEALGKDGRALLSLLETKEMTMEQAAAGCLLTTLLVYQLFFGFRVLGILSPAGQLAEKLDLGRANAPHSIATGARTAPPQPLPPDFPNPQVNLRSAGPSSAPSTTTSPIESKAGNTSGPPASIGTVLDDSSTTVGPDSLRLVAPPPPVDPDIPVAGSPRKEPYHVVRVEADKLDNEGVEKIEEVLGTWSRRGYRLAAVVPGKASGLFGSSPPAFFIFSRD